MLPVTLSGNAVPLLGRETSYGKELHKAKTLYSDAGRVTDSELARAAYDEIILLFQDSPDAEVRTIALQAYNIRISLEPEPRNRLALCDKAITRFGGDRECREHETFSRILFSKDSLVLDKSLYIDHYNRMAAESDNEKAEAEALLNKVNYLSDQSAKDALYNELLNRFRGSHRPDDLELVVRCIREKGRWDEFEEKKSLLYGIADAYYHSSHKGLRDSANGALRDLLFTSRHYAANVEPVDASKSIVEWNRLRIMLIDDARDDNDLGYVFSYLYGYGGTAEDEAITNFTVTYFTGRRTPAARMRAANALFEKNENTPFNGKFYDRVIKEYPYGEFDFSHVQSAYEGKIRMAKTPSEKLRLWNEFLAPPRGYHPVGDFLKKAEFMEAAGEDSLPVYEDIITRNTGVRPDRVEREVVLALNAKYGRVSSQKEKLAILDEIITVCRSEVSQRLQGHDSFFGPEYKSAVLRKSDILGEEPLKIAYFLEVIDWFHGTTDKRARGLVIDSLYELAEIAANPEEKARLYTRIVQTPLESVHSDAAKQVRSAYRGLIELAPTREDKVQLYEGFFKTFENAGEWTLREDKQKYEVLLKSK